MEPSFIFSLKQDFRRVAPNHGLDWLQAGWSLFAPNPTPWLVMGLIVAVVFGVLNLLPLLGQIAVNVLLPVFLGGLLLACRAADNGGRVRVDFLFVGFRQDTSKLVQVSLYYMAGAFVAFLAALVLGGMVTLLGSLVGVLGMAPGFSLLGSFSGLIISGLVFMVLFVPVLMAAWFAPALVVFQGMEAWPALRRSFSACWFNVLPMTVFVLLTMLLLILAAIPLGLGIPVAIPVLAASYYAAYIDIFE